MTRNKKETSGEEIYRIASTVLAGGVSRASLWRNPVPGYALKASGCHITDTEGVVRLDFANNMTSLIHGHARPEIIRNVTAQIRRGTAFHLATEAEVRFASHLCSRGGYDRVRFFNSGTEAVMALVRAARAFTGRRAVALARGAYHGNYDIREPIAFPFNDTARTLRILDRHASRIACVLIDPIPMRLEPEPATAGFIRSLERWAHDNGALFAFDEVVSFRNDYAGMAGHYQIKPDLVALGKIIGGGFPAGALAGRVDIMAVFDARNGHPALSFSGTFSANPVTMTAGLTAMTLFDHQAVDRLNNLGDHARKAGNEAARLAGVPVTLSGSGSLLRLSLNGTSPGHKPESRSERVIRAITQYLYQHENLLAIHNGTFAFSTAMGIAEADHLAEALLNCFRVMKREIYLASRRH